MKSDIYITDHFSYLKIKDGNLIVKSTVTKKETVFQIKHISSIVIMWNSTISASVYKACFKGNIPVYIVSPKWDYLGKIENLESTNISLRYLQYQKFFDENFKLEFAKKIVYYKLENQKRLLKRYIKNYKLKAQFAVDKIQDLQNKINWLGSIEKIRWLEWMAARIYFEYYGSIFSGILKFTKRTQRPPKDPINSLLSFGYTLLAQTIYTSLKLAELDVYCGYFHSPKDNRPILVLDMMENWRSLIVDSLIVRLYKLGSIQENAFTFADKWFYPVLLTDQFKKFFISSYQERINKQINYNWHKMPMKDVMKQQGRELVKYLKWEQDFTPYTFNY